MQGKSRKILENFIKVGEKSEISAKFQQIQIFLDQIMFFFANIRKWPPPSLAKVSILLTLSPPHVLT